MEVIHLEDAKEKRKAPPALTFFGNDSISSRQAVVDDGTTIQDADFADENIMFFAITTC